MIARAIVLFVLAPEIAIAEPAVTARTPVLEMVGFCPAVTPMPPPAVTVRMPVLDRVTLPVLPPPEMPLMPNTPVMPLVALL